jgi:hypothetical protein
MKQDDITLKYDEETRVINIDACKVTRFSSDNDTTTGASARPGADTAEVPISQDLPSDALSKSAKRIVRRQNSKALKKHGVLHHKVERSFGYISRSMSVPEDAELEYTKALYKDGLLVITMPRNKSQWKYKEHPNHIKTVTVESADHLTLRQFDQ